MLTVRALPKAVAALVETDAGALEWACRHAKADDAMTRHQGKRLPATERDAAVALFLTLVRPAAHRAAEAVATIGALTERNGSTFLEVLEELIALQRNPDKRVADKAGVVTAAGIIEAGGRVWPWVDHRERGRVVFGDLKAFTDRTGLETVRRITDAHILAIADALGPRSVADSECEDGAPTEANAPPSSGTNHRRATAGDRPRLATDEHVQSRRDAPARQAASGPGSSRPGLTPDEDEKEWPPPSRTRLSS